MYIRQIIEIIQYKQEEGRMFIVKRLVELVDCKEWSSVE